MTRNKPATKINMDRREKDIERHPDDCQWQPGQRFGVTQSAIHYALPRLGVSYKKTLQHPKTNQQARLNFQQKIKAYQQAGNPIVYLDESGFAQQMPRTHGYSKKGTRCYRTQGFFFIKYARIPRPEDHWPPLYFFLIAPLYLLFGEDTFISKLPSLIIRRFT